MVVATSLLGFITKAFSAFSRIERPHIAWTSVTIAIFALLTCAYVSPSPASATAGINRQINFQGRLLNSNGATVPDGFYNIQFKIYQDGDGLSVGNTTGSPAGTLMWTESHLNANSQGVTVKNGFLSVQLGSINAFANQIDWNQDTIWLSMNIGNTNASCTPFSSCSPDGEMVPMKRMTATPYALNSGLLNGLTSSNFVQLAQGVQTDASAGPSSIFINKTAAGNLLQLQSSGADAFTVSNAGDLTFGAAADHTISIATAAASTAGKTLTLVAGAGGSGTGSAGGDLVIQGGAAGGTDGNGGNLTINAGAKTGTGTDGTISIGTANTSAITLGQNTNVTGTLGVSSNVDTNGSLIVGNADQFVVSNLGVVTAGTWQGTAVNDTYVADTLTVDSSSTVDWQALNNYPAACAAGSAVSQLGDTITCTAFATGTAANYIQNQSAGAQATADFWISGTGRADTALQAPTFDTATAVALTLGGNATSISVVDDVTLSTGKTLTITGDVTINRPAGTEGQLYYDTDTNKLLVFSNGKWQADRTDAVIVAASNSSQADKDAADYVADGNTVAAADGDQVQINAALTAASGKKVVLLAGTYTADATILIPNNTTLAGVGNGTVVELADLDATDNLIENTDTTTGTGVTVRSLKLDGRSDVNTLGTQYGVYFNNMGAETSRSGGNIVDLSVTRFRTAGVYLNNSDNTSVRGNILRVNATGISVLSSNNVVISDNQANDNTVYGISMDTSQQGEITGNVAQGNTTAGIRLTGTGFVTVAGNSTGGSTYGIRSEGSSFQNTISGNSAIGNGYGISLVSNTDVTVSGNVISSNYDGIESSSTTGSMFTGNSLKGNAGHGIYLYGSSDNNSISSNVLANNGDTTTNNAIYLDNSDNNQIVNNTISDDSATTYNTSILISAVATSTGNYLAGNKLATGSNINDSGTGTIFGGQNDGTSYKIQPADDFVITGSAASTISTTAGDLTVQGGSGTVTLGTSTNLTASGALTIASAASTALTLTSNAAATWGTTSGDLTLDSGATLNLGTVNATALSLSKTGATTTVNGHLTIATGQNFTVNGDAFTDLTGSGLTLAGSSLAVDASSATGFFRNGGNSFGTTATLGTNDTNDLTLRTNGTTRATFDQSNNLYLGNGITNASPSNFVVQATGNSGTGAGASLTIQAGSSGASANGANLTLSGGTSANGVNGLVILSTPTFQNAGADANCYTGGAAVAGDCTIDASSVNNYSSIIVGFSASGKTATLPDPTITTPGRIVYIIGANGSSDFTLSVNGGVFVSNLIALRANASATMVWNGSDWTAAGASSSTTLQAAYDNTLQSSGGAELLVSKTANTNGLTIRDSAASPVNGAVLSVQSSSAAGLLSVNSNLTEYASNAGAETKGASDTTFPANTWSSQGSSTVSRNITTNNDTIATGQGSVAIATTASDGGAKNQLVNSTGSPLALTANNHYNVSFAVRLPSNASTTFTDLKVDYSADGTTGTLTSCTTLQSAAINVWTKINCSFTAPASGITTGNVIMIRQASSTARTFYIDNLSVTIAADYNLTTDGGADNPGGIGNSGSNWDKATFGGSPAGALAQDANDGQAASTSAKYTSVPATAKVGIRNKLAINPLPDTLYRVTVYAKSSNAFSDFMVRYTATTANSASDGDYVNCQDYNTRSVSTSAWTKITCYIKTTATTPTTSYLYFVQETGTARDFAVDTASITLSDATTPNVQVGGGTNGGPTTLFTLDRGASAPIAGDNDALLGSMYYDTTLGKLQCYEADGWGACGSSPDNIITISPEYTNAVMHGTGVGTMISDICSDFLDINDGSSGQSTICGTNETYNFYNWTSPQATPQTYSIYVTYQLPNTFKSFTSGSTSLQGRVSSTSNASINYAIYKNTGSSMTQCGSNVNVASGAANTWETKVATGAADPSACNFAAGNSIIFKISMSANSNANAYIGNIGFTFSNN